MIHSDGQYDKGEWEDALRETGPAARLGDQIQITSVKIEANKILWISMVVSKARATGTTTWILAWAVTPLGFGNQNGPPANGSRVELVFPGPIPSLKSAEIRRMLMPIFDFEKHSASDFIWTVCPNL